MSSFFITELFRINNYPNKEKAKYMKTQKKVSATMLAKVFAHHGT